MIEKNSRVLMLEKFAIVGQIIHLDVAQGDFSKDPKTSLTR